MATPGASEEKITKVQCTTTASPDAFTIQVNHAWSPLGAERFVELVEDDYFTDVAMFRCVKNFLVQFGIPPDAVSPKKRYWRERGGIKDDPSPGLPFKRGMLSFAGSGPNSRTTQTFITFVDLPHLGKTPWETPFGEVTEGMDTVVDKLYTGYGDQKPFNEDGVDQGVLQQRGNEYLRENFPKMDYLKECHVVFEGHAEGGHVQAAGAAPGDDDGGLWAGEERPPPLAAKVGETLTDGDGLDPSAAGQGVSSFTFVFLALTFGAIFVVWKRSQLRRNRRRS